MARRSSASIGVPTEQERGVGKKGNGEVIDLTAKILTEIRDGIREGFASVNARLDETNSRIDQTNSRIDQTNSRLDNLRDLAGDRYRGLDARVRALEVKVSKLRPRRDH